MKRTIYIALTTMLLISVSCEEKTDWPLEVQEADLIVVDGIITDEYKNHWVKITKPVENLNDDPEPVSGAQVSVYDGVAYHPLYEYPANSGYYFSDSASAGINREYMLEIRYNNNYYSAKTGMEPVSAFAPLTYTEAEDSEGFYQIDSNPEIFNSDDPCMWEIWIGWGFLPQYQNLPQDSCLVRLLAYSLPSIDVPQIFKPEKADVVFPYGSVIIQRKYSLTDEHAEFLRTLLSETEWRGGLFDVMPANVSTNLSEGAIGYFGACSVKSDTIWVH